MRKWRNGIGALALLLALVIGAPALGDVVVRKEVFLEGASYDPLLLQNGNLLLPLSTKIAPEGHVLKEGDYLAWLVCLSPEGDVVWDQYYGDLPGATVYCRFLELEDGSLMGWAHHGEAQVMDRVWKPTLSPTGEELSGEDMPSLDWPFLFALEGRFLYLEGEQYLCVTPSGETLWSISRDSTVRRGNRPVAVQDGILLLGVDPQRDTAAAVAKISYGGNLIWRSVMRSEGDSQLQKGVETRDGSMLAVGGTSIWEEQYVKLKESHGLAVLIGKDGTPRWEREYTLDGEGYSLLDVAELPQGYCALYTEDHGKTLNFLLLDPMGNERGRTSYRMKDIDAYSFSFQDWNGEVWVIVNGERNGIDGTLMLQLDPASLWP